MPEEPRNVGRAEAGTTKSDVEEKREEQVARRAEREAGEDAPKQLDETVEGGRYLVGDQVVNANGEVLKKD